MKSFVLIVTGRELIKENRHGEANWQSSMSQQHCVVGSNPTRDTMNRYQEVSLRIGEIEKQIDLLREESKKLNKEREELVFRSFFEEKKLSKARWEISLSFDRVVLRARKEDLPELDKMMCNDYLYMEVTPGVTLNIRDNDLTLTIDNKENAVELLRGMGIVPCSKGLDKSMKQIQNTLDNLIYLSNIIKGAK